MDIRPINTPLSQLASGTPAPAVLATRDMPAARKAVAEAASPAESTAEKEKVEEAIKSINVALRDRARDLEFSVDDQRTVIKVIDKSTKEVIMQFPSQEVIEIAKALDKLTGLLTRQTA